MEVLHQLVAVGALHPEPTEPEPRAVEVVKRNPMLRTLLKRRPGV